MLIDTTPTFEYRITLGTVITIASNAGLAAAFLFKKYYRSEEDTKTIESHKGLIAEQATILAKLSTTQESQQKLLEIVDKRIERIENRIWNDGRDFERAHPRGGSRE